MAAFLSTASPQNELYTERYCASEACLQFALFELPILLLLPTFLGTLFLTRCVKYSVINAERSHATKSKVRHGQVMFSMEYSSPRDFGLSFNPPLPVD